MTFLSYCEQDTEDLGRRLARSLPAGGQVIAMYGELGAGKTAFIRGLGQGLGIQELISSPTFTIVNEYQGERELFHFDMYRLSSAEELFDIGWDDYLARGGICAVEWSENVTRAFDGSEIVVTLRKTGESSREITIEGVTLC